MANADPHTEAGHGCAPRTELLASGMTDLLHLRCYVGKLALLQLSLPENGVHVAEAVLDPAIFLDVIQVDEATRVCVAMHGLVQRQGQLLLAELCFLIERTARIARRPRSRASSVERS
jgi:hypothetical protein